MRRMPQPPPLFMWLFAGYKAVEVFHNLPGGVLTACRCNIGEVFAVGFVANQGKTVKGFCEIQIKEHEVCISGCPHCIQCQLAIFLTVFLAETVDQTVLGIAGVRGANIFHKPSGKEYTPRKKIYPPA